MASASIIKTLRFVPVDEILLKIVDYAKYNLGRPTRTLSFEIFEIDSLNIESEKYTDKIW